MLVRVIFSLHTLKKKEKEKEKKRKTSSSSSRGGRETYFKQKSAEQRNLGLVND